MTFVSILGGYWNKYGILHGLDTMILKKHYTGDLNRSGVKGYQGRLRFKNCFVWYLRKMLILPQKTTEKYEKNIKHCIILKFFIN